MSDHGLQNLTGFFLDVPDLDEPGLTGFAEDLAMVLKRGDTICLSGDLGAGKSTVSRALIRALADDRALEVPSPTFTLVQTYDLPRFSVSHFDLYRIEDPEELFELGLDDLLETGAALIEWPEKASDHLPENALWIRINEAGEAGDRRSVHLQCKDPDWRQRVVQTRNIRAFLADAGFANAGRRHLAGDASLRTFETVHDAGRTAVLMRWPFQSGAISEAVQTYMNKAHLAQDCRAVVAIGAELRKNGFRAPELFASDTKQGLLLSQYLGSETLVRDNAPVPERYRAAVELLAAMHARDWPDEIALADGGLYTVPVFSNEALIAEASLFLEWYLPEKTGSKPDAQVIGAFEDLWQGALDSIADAQSGWVLRDFHSPNLLWQAGEQGTDRIGLIDFQDTVIGPVAYDTASLLLDARTNVGEDLETELFEAYLSARRERCAGFDEDGFSRAYHVMALQRISKLLGIFVRLARRDGKPAYLGHLPRMLEYLGRVLDRSELSDLKLWYAPYRP